MKLPKEIRAAMMHAVAVALEDPDHSLMSAYEEAVRLYEAEPREMFLISANADGAVKAWPVIGPTFWHNASGTMERYGLHVRHLDGWVITHLRTGMIIGRCDQGSIPVAAHVLDEIRDQHGSEAIADRISQLPDVESLPLAGDTP